MAPVTAMVPETLGDIVTLAAVAVAALIGSEKVTLIAEDRATFVAPFAGTVETTVGGVVSPLPPLGAEASLEQPTAMMRKGATRLEELNRMNDSRKDCRARIAPLFCRGVTVVTSE